MDDYNKINIMFFNDLQVYHYQIYFSDVKQVWVRGTYLFSSQTIQTITLLHIYIGYPSYELRYLVFFFSQNQNKTINFFSIFFFFHLFYRTFPYFPYFPKFGEIKIWRCLF